MKLIYLTKEHLKDGIGERILIPSNICSLFMDDHKHFAVKLIGMIEWIQLTYNGYIHVCLELEEREWEELS